MRYFPVRGLAGLHGVLGMAGRQAGRALGSQLRGADCGQKNRGLRNKRKGSETDFSVHASDTKFPF